MSNETVTLRLIYREGASTVSTWAVSEDEDSEVLWLPRSKVERDESSMKKLKSGGVTYDFEIPEWLAKERGLI